MTIIKKGQPNEKHSIVLRIYYLRGIERLRYSPWAVPVIQTLE
jgi:hypothetical protein